ncbi:zinc finger protein 729 [Chelonus insularis]|uniref:zinc finger protein 729 n=1 Tax=Chelonus insularis TaxID=460826 RepID=UPI001589031F|nr:zinc finger protein 729 [Chelonus insularis]
METNYEDDDDTHYCIKCHLTISGLDNYVQHRQVRCRPTESKSVSSEPPSTEVSYPEILNADAFFSSLELQSSSKSKQNVTRFLEPERKSDRLLGKRKRAKKYHDIEESNSKEKLISLPPVVTDLDDPTDHIGIPSLVGFPDIVTFTEKSSATSTKLQSTTGSKPVDNDKKRNEDHRVWLDDLEDYDANKETVSTADSDTEFAYQPDDDLDVESPVDDIGQDDSYSETDYPDDREYPPQAHTGGKWKPGQLVHHMTVSNDDELDQDDYHHENLVPPHSGGKWKPTEQKAEEDESVEAEKEDEDKESALMKSSRRPPLGHTRGKWIPGASVTSEVELGYWCAPCGRKLASKLVYTRHLRSDLHARRSIQEIEGDVKLPRSVGPLLRKKDPSRRQKILAIKKAESKKIIVDNNRSTKRKRCREKQILRCEMCHARVHRPQLGKHLLSHYHCRVAGLNPCSTAARRFILENMGNVVRQCPFQCTSCRFYCNTEDTFLRHWRSDLHINSCNEDDKNYTCVCCDYWCQGDTIMEKHLLSLEHRETVAMINNSVPIIIRRQRFLSCETCNRRFRYNLQLRLHSKETGHPESWTASNEYQRIIKCTLCPQILRSLLALQRHQLTCHKLSNTKDEVSAPYFCSFCSINFKTAQDAVLHRRTISHKQIVKESKSKSEVISVVKECKYCQQKFNNLLEYKQHLLQNHPDFCHKCLNCKKYFALSQDLTKHTKYDKCQENTTKMSELELISTVDQKNCPECSFVTKSEAEFLFHQALHAGNVEFPSKQTNSRKTAMFRCPVCKKIFTKTSLRAHIRSHTGEKPYSCSKCSESFSKKSSLNLHIIQCQLYELNEKKVRERKYICLDCNTAFYTKNNLRQHMLRHTGKDFKCSFSGCPTVLRTEAELKNHQALIHSEKDTHRKFQCNECSYAAKTKTQLRRHQIRHKSIGNEIQQLSCSYKGCWFTTRFSSHLKRHVRLHTGTKPYKCPHCSYASNNIENLRKHVLSTKLHPGKTIYECDHCKKKKKDTAAVYVTNFLKELRAHLIEEHSEEFPTLGHANSYVAGMFGSDGQSTPHE